MMDPMECADCGRTPDHPADAQTWPEVEGWEYDLCPSCAEKYSRLSVVRV